MANGNARYHVFYAEASSFTARVENAGGAIQIVPEQAFQRLSQYGGNQNSPRTPWNQPGVVSIASGYTSIGGVATPGGWTTSVKSVVEGLDICGKITADKITAEVTTQYPLAGYVPSVSFQGTQFVNLKVEGNLVNPQLNLNMCSPQPPGDAPYIDDAGLLGRAQAEYNIIANSAAPPDVRAQFQWNPGVIHRRGKVDCSLVTGVGGLPAAQAFGHVLVLPNVGYVYLAELAVGNHIELTMVRVELTARGTTELRTVNTDSQGHTMP